MVMSVMQGDIPSVTPSRVGVREGVMMSVRQGVMI